MFRRQILSSYHNTIFTLDPHHGDLRWRLENAANISKWLIFFAAISDAMCKLKYAHVVPNYGVSTRDKKNRYNRYNRHNRTIRSQY